VDLSDLAQLTDIRGMVLARRLLTDGRLPRRRLERLAPIGTDAEVIVAELIKAGLWTEAGDSLIRRGWAEWNAAAGDIEVRSKGGTLGNHRRWHEAMGRVSPDCPHCPQPDDSPAVGTESLPNRVPNPQTRDRPETDQTTTEADPVDATGAKADRVVVVVAQRLAEKAARAGKIRGEVGAYQAGIENRIRSKAFPIAHRVVIDHPDDTVEELARRVTAEIEPDAASAAPTVPLSESHHPAAIAEMRRRRASS
jgi:hypothetical protein